jgi:adenine deaminase
VKKIKEIDEELIVAKNRRILSSLKLNIAELMSLKFSKKFALSIKKLMSVKNLGIKLNEFLIQMFF